MQTYVGVQVHVYIHVYIFVLPFPAIQVNLIESFLGASGVLRGECRGGVMSFSSESQRRLWGGGLGGLLTEVGRMF